MIDFNNLLQKQCASNIHSRESSSNAIVSIGLVVSTTIPAIRFVVLGAAKQWASSTCIERGIRIDMTLAAPNPAIVFNCDPLSNSIAPISV
jgi:hypothetical protein